MRVIPVLDLRAGGAVWARGGARERYEPVKSVLAPGSGDAPALVRGFAALGCEEVYLADLDALERGALQANLVRTLARSAALLVDRGVRDSRDVGQVLELGARRAAVALETLPSWTVLQDSLDAHGSAHVVFSLDLRAGIPVTALSGPEARSPMAIMERAVQAGVRSALLLDLSRVGSGAGLDWELLEHLRRAVPGVELLAGGGIAGPDDLERARDAGCDAVLVGSALHRGALDRRALDRWRERRVHSNDSR